MKLIRFLGKLSLYLLTVLTLSFIVYQAIFMAIVTYYFLKIFI